MTPLSSMKRVSKYLKHEIVIIDDSNWTYSLRKKEKIGERNKDYE